ncbi:hypothetical protein DFJ67_5997 [Asanoa ferruginea]|uniref:Uncharacterized protein n=1 Tax=Asanoa ferruginea TaxID=53367 RepID=A0A3E0A168_9ACTN|nr:hypothetical protein [Asanoa ferruginea]REF99950.1 hypothetical protein DFJ67_5997 [Asanoa ferruginea]GIF53170.1 hypothetical protein Afe04nite_77090 [Asanoa ferruginea]
MSRRYLPSWRIGAGTLVNQADGPAVPSEATLNLAARVTADPARSATLAARLYGPGRVTGLDVTQIIRTEPAAGATDFEPNYLCAVEFDAPELPWMFTPAAPNALGQLRPWLVLVVVRRSAATLDPSGRRPSPVLVTDPSAELPDLAQSWAWAHVQLTGAGAATDLLTTGPAARTLSRLLCPRRLDPDTAYVAALVPAFAQGAQSGLGLPVDGGDLRPAWLPTDQSVELPVYHSWEFATGPAGDFEELAARLRLHQPDAAALAGLPLSIPAQPGLPDGGTVRVPGALGTGGQAGSPVDADVADAIEAMLEADELPAYGRWHAGRPTAWLAGLVLEPAARAVAALGTRVVQERQEQLMAAAWAQVGPVQRANQLLRQAQLAREAGGALWRRHLVPLPDAALLAVAGPAATRLSGADRRTIAAHVAASRVPAALFTVAARRAARHPRTAALIIRANARDGSAGRPRPVGEPALRPPGMVSVDDLRGRDDLPPLCGLTPDWWAKLPPAQTPVLQAMRKALATHAAGAGPCAPRPPRPPLDVAGLAGAARTGLDPRTAVTAATLARLTLPAGWAPADPLEPVLAAPDFPTPMFRTVAELAPSLLLPGVNDLPRNSVSLVGTNPWFTHAFLVGLNHEMGRELLWRGYPTDQRGTYFRRFWDRRGSVPPKTGADLDDITAIPEWTVGDPLGAAGAAGADSARLVLVIRGELLRRYPRTVIYAARAQWSGDAEPVPRLAAGAEERHPEFSGALPPDVAFLGFDLTVAAARGTDTDPGWYVVFAEPPTEPRYGLDVDAPAAPTGTWGDLSWAAVTVDASGHLRLGATDPVTVSPAVDPRGLHLTATTTSAQVAAIVEQRQYRVAIHARRLLPEPTP